MHSKKFALAALATVFLSTTALAQSSPPAGSPATPPAATMEPTAVQSTAAQNQWRASKLIGVDVYNAANEKIGDINELMTDSAGKIDIVVIGVGGFLGMGTHNVGIPFAQLKWVNEPPKSTTASGTTARTTGAGTSATTTTTTTTTASQDYPDHAVVDMTKDQLKALPAFKYASDTPSSRTTTTTTPAAPPANPPAAR